jgi:hypothetical protein
MVTTGACATVSCISNYAEGTCLSGQICKVSMTGAFTASCIANPCGAGPITPYCLTEYIPSLCYLNATTTVGVTLTCNYCGTTCE